VKACVGSSRGYGPSFISEVSGMLGCSNVNGGTELEVRLGP